MTGVRAALAAGLALAALAAAPCADAFTVSTAHGVIGFPVRVGPRSARCELDTGASFTLLDARLARALHLDTGPSERHEGAGAGGFAVAFARGPVVLTLPDGSRDTCARAGVADLSGVRAADGGAVDVVLGQDWIASHVLTLDYEGGRVRLHDPASFVPSARATRVPLAREGAWRMVDVGVEAGPGGMITRRVLLDSGSEDAVDDSLVLADPAKRQTTTGVGLGAPTHGWLGHLRAVRFGDVVLHDVPSAWPGRALLGGAVLRRFRVTLDEPHDCLWLEPGAHVHDPF
ncbi:MAG TPA: aspartyl protease family protein [Candidatus Eisenbacteria bacterium]|nr:aspartyl protease family protein [Candidatus Eisenbacteria bacterium]